MSVSDQEVTVATLSLNLATFDADAGPKRAPEIATTVPARPDAGDTPVMTGASVTVKGKPLVTIPLALTTTLPVVAPEGTTTVMDVAVQLFAAACVPLKVTVPDMPKFDPERTTWDPTGPAGGDSCVRMGLVPGTVNGTQLLLGPDDGTTATKPVTAVAGTVNDILVSLQLMIGAKTEAATAVFSI